jgi:hypothetical protein
MTQKEFFKAISCFKDWRLTEDGLIRRMGNQCPITALENAASCHWEDVSKRLGLGGRFALDIVSAADDKNDLNFVKLLRRKLLKATHLEEKI